METSPETLDKGVLKKTQAVDWTISPKLLSRNMARTGVFSSRIGSHCLFLISETNLPENMQKFDVFLLSKALVEHTVEATFSLLDDNNRQCNVVEKQFINSSVETRKVCITVDFSIVPHYLRKFFHGGALKIQCHLDINESTTGNFKPQTDGFNKLEADLQKHVLDIPKAGVLAEKDVYTWITSETSMRSRNEIMSDQFKFASSVFNFGKLSSMKSKKSSERFEICLFRKGGGLLQKVRATLALLDNMGTINYIKEEVSEESCRMFLNFGPVFEDRGKFLSNGKFKVYCSLQTDNSSKVTDFAVLKPGGSSLPENCADVSSTSSETFGGKESTPLSGKQFWKSVETPSQESVVKDPNKYACSKTVGESQLEEALNEIFQLVHGVPMDALFASRIIALLFSIAKEDYKGTIAKVLLNFLKENDSRNETDFKMVSGNIFSVTAQWLSLMKSEPELADAVIKRLAFEK